MNIIILVNGVDLTDTCLISDTRISYDSNRRITTASLTIEGDALANTVARYDYAYYDNNIYGNTVVGLSAVTILDGRDGTTVLFRGQIYALNPVQSDAPDFSAFYKAELNDATVYLDRSVCWDDSYSVSFPTSDVDLIVALVGHFCPQIVVDPANLYTAHISFDSYAWISKTCRQVLDDICKITNSTWTVDFDSVLHYGSAGVYPIAPIALTTDWATYGPGTGNFPVNVSSYRLDFTNPINRCHVRYGQGTPTSPFGMVVFEDPSSIVQYGVYESAVVDTSIDNAYDAETRAESIVNQYAFPVQSGTFTVWGDDYDVLKMGQLVQIKESNLGLFGYYLIVALEMRWNSQTDVEWRGQFGNHPPDLEILLKTMLARLNMTTVAL